MSTENELWIATGNDGKLREFQLLLKSLPLKIHSQKELSVFYPPPENGSTFVENARIKAKALRALKPTAWVIGDDSGLEVEGLKGLPGIHSARYAGPKASDRENTAKLLKMVEIRTPQMRAAQFRCVIVAFSPTGQEWVVEGILKGSLALKERGTGGFGYDNIFIPEGHNQTLAEIGLATKNQISHRALACAELVTLWKPLLPIPNDC